ncbi:MAG: hypothetical protein AAF840_10555 [Bacteroidota bacterium]
MKKCTLLLLMLIVLGFSACEKDFYEPLAGEDDEWVEGNPGDDEVLGEEGALTLYAVSGDNITKVRDFDVPNRLRSYQQDVGRHTEIWEFFTRLIPATSRTKIVEFEIFFGDQETDGYVAPVNSNDLSRWRMGLAIDAAGDLTTIDLNDLFTHVVIHELAHVLTLDNSQLNVGGNEDSCPEFFPGEGCSRPTAYINQFFDLAWTDIYAAHNFDRPERTYQRYPDRFVSEYAATNPGEDIAETISFFITEPNRRTGNRLVDQKVNLFYEFSEMVSLRESIRSRADVNGLAAGVSLGTLRAKMKPERPRHGHSH